MRAFCFLLFILFSSVGSSQINQPINASTTLPSIQELRTNLRVLLNSETNYPKGLPDSDLVSQKGNYPEYYKTSIHLVPNDRANITVYLNGLKEIVKYSFILGSYDNETASKVVYEQWLPLLTLAVPEFNIAIDVSSKDYGIIKKMVKKSNDKVTLFTLLHYKAVDGLWYVVLNYNTADNEDMHWIESEFMKEEASKNSLYYKAMSAVQTKSYSKARKLFTKIVKKEPADYSSLYQLGLIYRYGLETKVDNAKAKSIFETAALSGMMRASYEIGLLMAEQGQKTAALQWFETAAKQGSSISKRAYEYELASQKGLSEDLDATNYTSNNTSSENMPIVTGKLCTECKGTGKLQCVIHDGKTDNTETILGKPVTCFACGGKGHH
jgi:tetratricopeptide (TPR) repeat protein